MNKISPLRSEQLRAPGQHGQMQETCVTTERVSLLLIGLKDRRGRW